MNKKTILIHYDIYVNVLCKKHKILYIWLVSIFKTRFRHFICSQLITDDFKAKGISNIFGVFYSTHFFELNLSEFCSSQSCQASAFPISAERQSICPSRRSSQNPNCVDFNIFIFASTHILITAAAQSFSSGNPPKQLVFYSSSL